MQWAALIAWVATAGGGFVMLAIWLSRGGMRQSREAGNRIRPPLILGHFLLAATGLVLWIVYIATDSDALAWVALALLAVVAVAGFTVFAVWDPRPQRGAAAATGVHGGPRPPGPPPRPPLPAPLLPLNGLAPLAPGG